MQPVKVLFILNSLAFGGAERQSIDLINKLNRNRFSIGLAYLDKIENLKPNIKEKNLFLCECLERKGKIDFTILSKIKKIILAHDVQIIICIEEYPLLYASLYKLLFKQPVVINTVIHHVLYPPGLWEHIKKRLYKIIINKTDKVFFVCHNQAQYWQLNNGINKSISTVVYNGVNASFFAPNQIGLPERQLLQKSLSLSESDFIVGICARLDPIKCHIDFLNGLAQTKKAGVRIKGLIIGDGPERERIKTNIRLLDLMDDVIITGFVEDTRSYISICDCLTITSHSEAFSISALEAMAMAKPLVMTKIGGAEEQVNDGKTGFLYNVGDTKALASHLIWLGTNPEKSHKMGNKARDFLLENFTLRKMAKSYEAQLLQFFN